MIRPARDGDTPAIRTLQSLLDAPAPSLLEAALRNDSAATGEILVADSDGVIGYALAVPGPVDTTPSVVYLAELAVAPAHRRSGHATALIEAVRTRYEQYDRVHAVVAADEDAALEFYVAVGFESVATLPDRFKGRDGRLLVSRLA